MHQRIIIGGGGGHVGKNLVRTLLARRCAKEVIVLSRHPEQAQKAWLKFAAATAEAGNDNNTTTITDSVAREAVRFEKWSYLDADTKEHESVSAVVNLTGKNVTRHRWTSVVREQLFESRLRPTSTLLQFCDKGRAKNVKMFIGTSAVGYYHTVETASDQDRPYTEHSDKSSMAPNAVGELCEDVERLVLTVDKEGTLTHKGSQRDDLKRIACRPAVVLAPDGGVVPALSLSAAFVKPIMGTGKQPFPFIHVDDLCAAYATLLEQQGSVESGVVNCVAPSSSSTTWEDLASELSRQMLTHIPGGSLLSNVFPIAIPLPQSLMTKLLGEERSVMLCEGAKIDPQRLREMDFRFRFPEIASCLEDICNRMTMTGSMKMALEQLRQ